VFREGELSQRSNVQNMHIANSDKLVKYYRLHVVISVGYRVKSLEGTRFRQWGFPHFVTQVALMRLFVHSVPYRS
jgi:hypothetical protein